MPVRRDPVGPGQESVWDYPRPPSALVTPRHVLVEFGAEHPKDVSPDPANDFHARDFLELAGQLGC